MCGDGQHGEEHGLKYDKEMNDFDKKQDYPHINSEKLKDYYISSI